MNDIQANSAADLFPILSASDIAVPARTKGRSTAHVERWSLCRFLAAHANTNLFAYPMRATIRDRPDVLLTLPFGLVGIEITEGLPADWARVDALREHSQIEGVTFLSRFRPKQPARNKSEIAFMASGRDQGSAWGGDSTERDWAEAMAHSVEIKTAKSRRPGFVRFDANWLLIYDGWPLPRVDMQKASAKLLSHLNEFSAPAAFDRIFIESQKEIWQFSADAATSVPIVDLWL